MLGATALGAVALLAGCGGDGNDAAETPTASPTLTPAPTATQDVIQTPVAGYSDPARWQGRTLTFAARGGDYQEAQQTYFVDPFAAATGVSVQVKTADTERFKDQVERGEVTWDVLTFPAEEAISYARAGYLEAIDYSVVDATSLYTEAALQHGVAADFFSTVMIYPKSADPIPQTWADFWEVQPPAPGQDVDPAHARALRHSPIGNLEFALIADGVELDKLYPLDVDRAFAKLEQIRSNVSVWYEDGKLPVEMIVQGQAAMASAWNVRITQLGVDDDVRLEWYGGMVSADVWVIPKGAPNRDVAMDFINFATRAIPTANFARVQPYGPPNKDAFRYLRPDRATELPSSPVNWSVQFVQNWNWWADNLDAVGDRFNAWLITEPAGPGTATPEP